MSNGHVDSRTFTLTFNSDWQVGTSTGIPGVSDRALLRDRDGLPFIPGRTLRGVLRDTHRELAAFYPADQYPSVSNIWGSQNGGDLSSFPGSWVISNGELKADLRAALMELSDIDRNLWLDEMTYISPRIALDPNKRTREQHLGFMEVGRKELAFEFAISKRFGQPFEEKELDLIGLLEINLRRVGGIRRRGKGQVRLTQNKSAGEGATI
ncbi:MAG: hypothetical protein KDI06_14050 [Calditrichaeota bacterium]|nr:hypothetical protein [Calditrichota bacterium]HQU73367.1 RAMP superfamily CRISPR-associated protein [Calditrichia bacterium]